MNSLLRSLLSILLWMLSAVSSGNAQVVLSQTVAVDATGVVLAPTNFWSANGTGLSSALAASGNFISLTQWNGLSNALVSTLTPPAGPFALTISGLTATVGAGNILWPGGSSLSFAGGSAVLFPNLTNFLVLNYGTGRLHTLTRFLGGGGEHLLAVVVTGPTGIAGAPLVNTLFAALPTRIPSARSRLLSGASRFDLVLLGDSTTEASGTGTMWKDLLFSPTTVAAGFNVTNVASFAVRNFGLGGMNADYGLALASRSAQSFGYIPQGYGGHGTALDLAGPPVGLASRTFQPQSGFSSLFSPLPDLVTIGFGINAALPQSGAYAYPDLEALARRCLEMGVPVLYLTENDFAGNPGSLAPLAAAVTILMQSIGGAVADTAAYVDERNRLGTNTYADAVHSNQAGWNAWAEAILGVFNPWPQAPLTVPVTPNRVLDPPVTYEAPYLGLGSTFVGGTVISRSAGVTTANNAGGISTNYLPGAFSTTLIQNIPGNPQNYVDYYHSCWSSASLVFERGVGANGVGTNSFTGYSAWLDQSGNEQRLRNFSFSDDNNPGGPGPFQRPGTLDVASVTQVLPAITNLTTAGLITGGGRAYWNHGALRIAITSGNARVLGVLFRGPRHRKLPLGRGGADWYPSSTWFDDTADPFGWYPHLFASDTVGDILGLRFRGKGIQITFRRSTSAGQLALYGNGSLLQSQDLFSQGRPPWIHQWLPAIAPGADLAKGDTEADWVLNYAGNNGSHVAASAGYHGVAIFDALEIY